ncbi:hypothetical protein [Rubrivirga sp.]|uniref:hypothetical protein n=1 Tax=Rubrivirga sp. TaxID=1885344 RepID=UPI003B524A1C
MRVLLLFPFLAAVALAQPADPDPLATVADALGGRDRVDAIDTIRRRSRTRTTLGERTLDVRATVEVRLPDAARWTVRAPGPARITWVDGDEGGVVGGGEARPLPEASAAAAGAALWFDPLVLAARRDEVTAESLGPALLRVDVPGRRDPLIVGLNAAGRPARITTFRRHEGRRDYVEVVLRDYREVGGVFVPHLVRQAVGGVVTGEETVREVRLGVDLAGAPFAGDG